MNGTIKRILAVLAAGILLSSPTGAAAAENGETDFMREKIAQDFQNPPDRFKMRWLSLGFSENWRGVMDGLWDRGYRGIISNVNFNSRYLRDDAEFDRLKEVYAYAKERGMALWIYDEYQWPSGKAFGQVLEGHPEFQAKGIEHHRLAGDGGTAEYRLVENDIAVRQAFLTDAEGERALEVGTGNLSVAASGRWTLDVYVLRYTYDDVEDPADFRTLEDVDLLNPAAVERFIDLTYRKYRDEFGRDFDEIEAFFTDEPQLGNRGMTSYAVWTEGLEEAFEAKYGHPLDWRPVFSGFTVEEKRERIRYYALVGELFRKSYTETITRWCEENGTASSGHFLFEENMNDHIETYGGDFLRLVGGMTIPGLDLLWVDPVHLLSDTNIGSYMAARYVVSAAKNAGKRDVMVEWNPAAIPTNEEFKADVIGTSLGGAALTRLWGVTVYNVIDHLHSYTVEENNRLNDTIARMSSILEGADESCDTALFYPIATMQGYHNADADHSSSTSRGTEATDRNARYAKLCLDLLERGLLYTVLDDQAIAGASVTEDGCLLVGNGVYRTVILAWAETVSEAALNTLSKFTDWGGRVIFIGDIPSYSADPHAEENRADERVAALAQKLAEGHFFARAGTTALDEITAHAFRRMNIEVPVGLSLDGLFSGDFHTEERDITFLVNSRSESKDVTLTFADGYEGTSLVCFPVAGEIEERTGAVSVTLPPYEGAFVLREADNRREYRVVYTGRAEDEQEPAASGGKGSGTLPVLPVVGAAVAGAGLAAAAILSSKRRKAGQGD